MIGDGPNDYSFVPGKDILGDLWHMQTASEDLYVILGVHKTATNEEIKKSYHKLALKYAMSLDRFLQQIPP